MTDTTRRVNDNGVKMDAVKSPLSTNVREDRKGSSKSENGSKYDSISHIVRIIPFFICFLTIALCLHVQQLVGAPLYWINRAWYYRWQAVVKESTALLIVGLNQWRAPAIARISGDASVQDQIYRTADGKVTYDFPDRLVLISNHQIYTDWIFLWWTAYAAGHHGDLFIVLKDSIRMIPIVGPGLMLFSWIFLSRRWESDQARLQHRLGRLSDNKERPPMWLLIFPEGTNMSTRAHAVSKRWSAKLGTPEFEYTLVPRSRGLQFVLQGLNDSIDWVYDCTLAYDGIPVGEYGQEVHSLKKLYIDGQKAPLAHLYWRRFAVKDIPVQDEEAFTEWLNARWTEKEELMIHHQKHGGFPTQSTYIEAEIKLHKLTEYIQILWSVPAVLAVWWMLKTALLIVKMF